MASLADMLEEMRQNEAAGKKLPELAKKHPKPHAGQGKNGNVVLPPSAPKYSIPYSDPSKWGVGGPMIQQQKATADPEKWERNWQSNQPEICQLSERSKRIMRGEDPDGN